MLSQKNFILLNKAIYFPKQKILAISDLHLGYDKMLKNQGITFPFNQLEHTKKEVQDIINELKTNNFQINKIVINGDLKHHFQFERGELFDIRNFLNFLEGFVKRENIIIIKGNHEKFELDSKKQKPFHIESDIGFTHGDKLFPEILDKKIKTIVLGHVHPAITLKDKQKVKKEKYKAFFIGKWKRKNIIILPSFFPFIEGTSFDVSDHEYNYFDKFFIIPKTTIKKFNAFILGKDKIYEFGKLNNIN
ncbi:MAG: metallophosphoesterase [Candidatus Nanoarchaeia archaeon]